MERNPINRPIDYLEIFVTTLNGDLSSVNDQYDRLLPIKDKPSVLNDEIIGRIIRLHKEKNDFIKLYEKQFINWRKLQLTATQSSKLDELESKLPKLKSINEKVLELAYHIQPHTIDKIMGMSSEELAIRFISDNLKPPKD